VLEDCNRYKQVWLPHLLKGVIVVAFPPSKGSQWFGMIDDGIRLSFMPAYWLMNFSVLLVTYVTVHAKKIHLSIIKI